MMAIPSWMTTPPAIANRFRNFAEELLRASSSVMSLLSFTHALEYPRLLGFCLGVSVFIAVSGAGVPCDFQREKVVLG